VDQLKNLLKMSIMESQNVEDILILTQIESFINEPGRPAIYYKIRVDRGNDLKWTIERRYSEFDHLNRALKRKACELPRLPRKSFFRLKKDEDLKRRMEGLDSYLKQVSARRDIFTSSEFRSFLQLDVHSPDTASLQPICLGCITHPKYGVHSFRYIPENETLFMATYDTKTVRRIDHYTANLSLPWEKESRSH